MHLPLVPTNKKNVVSKSEVFNTRPGRGIVVEVLQIKVEEPGTRVMPEYQTTAIFTFRFSGLIVKEFIGAEAIARLESPFASAQPVSIF